MNINISTIPHNTQRYNTCGDWYYEGDALVINVSELGDWKKEALIAFHELAEALICKSNFIDEQSVTDFDKAYDGTEPGESPDAPYFFEHFTATTMERLLADHLMVDWIDYEKSLEKLQWIHHSE